MNNKIIFAVLAVAVVAVVAVMVMRGERNGSDSTNSDPLAVVASPKPTDKNVGRSEAAKLTSDKKLVSSPGHVEVEIDERDLIDEEKIGAITRDLEEMLDDDNRSGILREAERLYRHPEPEVRSRVAFALDWVGLPALPLLTKMLVDPDPEVAEEVQDFWRGTLAEVENEFDKAEMLDAAAEIFGDDITLEFLDDLIIELDMLEEVVALPKLIEMLKRVEDQECVDLLIEAIDSIVASDETPTTKADSLLQALAYQIELEEEAAEDITPAEPITELTNAIVRPRK